MLLVPQPGKPNPSASMESYLGDVNSDPILLRLQASQSRLPNNDLYRVQGYHGTSRDEPRTSMMLSGSDHTRDSQSQDLPAFTSASSRSLASTPSSVGGRQIERQRLLEAGSEEVLNIPGLRNPRILECPFNFLDCILTFSDEVEWIQHSLEHFHPIGPSTSNACCFCDAAFHHPEGRQSWLKRMQHVALHHVLSHKLAHARPDFKLFEYLWSNKLISNAVYKDLKGNSQRREREVTPRGSGKAHTQTNTNRHRHKR